MKKFMVIVIFLLIFFISCKEKEEITFNDDLNIKLLDISINNELDKLMINYKVSDEDKKVINSSIFNSFCIGVVYRYINDTDVSYENKVLNINPLNHVLLIEINDEYFKSKFSFQFYYIYKLKEQEEKVIYIDEIYNYDLLDLAKKTNGSLSDKIIEANKNIVVINDINLIYDEINDSFIKDYYLSIKSINNEDYLKFEISIDDDYVISNDLQVTINGLKYDYQLIDNIIVIIYEDYLIMFNKVIDKLNERYKNIKIIDNDIELVEKIDDATITWNSNNIDVLSQTGLYSKPYKKTIISLTATINMKNKTQSISYEYSTSSFKELSTPIASTYTYRNYDLCDDEYFSTFDIINCAFATANDKAEITGNTFFNNCTKYILPKAHEMGCYVVMSIAPESSWTKIANPDNALIETFSNNIVNVINKYGFDGVDIDWEYPKTGQYTWFTEMMKVIYQKVKNNNKNHIVSSAIGGGKWQPPRYDLLNSNKYIDYINVMLYGMCSESGYYQNALYPSKNNDNKTFKVGRTLQSCSFLETIDLFTKEYKVEKEKLILGLAFYGIKQTYTPATYTYENGKSVLYTNLVKDYLNNPLYTYYFDNICKVPYLLKNDGSEFISFDDSLSIQYKCQYVIDNGIGGIMNWESGCDKTNTLLRAIKTSLNK